MSYAIRVLSIMICASSVLGGLEARQQAKRRAVMVPRQVALAAVVQQPSCPLRILKVEKLFFLDKWPGWRYQVRNEGSQPIRSYSIAEVTSAGTGSMFSRIIKPLGKLLMPGESDAPDDPDQQIEIVPLSKQLREDLKVGESLRAVMLFMVVRVEFADGSIYSEEQTKDALSAFFFDNAVQPRDSKKH